jgi:hypothetical protein
VFVSDSLGEIAVRIRGISQGGNITLLPDLSADVCSDSRGDRRLDVLPKRALLNGVLLSFGVEWDESAAKPYRLGCRRFHHAVIKKKP